MELNKFIENALVEIVQGVEAAKAALKEQGDSICYPLDRKTSKAVTIPYDHSVNLYFQEVEFDVAITVDTENSNGGTAGIRVFGIEAGIGGKNTAKNSVVSRIKFSVPLGLKASKPPSE